jgi:hypothetical protein
MTDERKGVAYSGELLTDLLTKLDDVMAEAARLRQQVSRQLADQRSDQQQKITVPTRKKTASRTR